MYNKNSGSACGIGFDQLLTLEPARETGDLFLDIKNPDGTSAEACGNGTRCVASLMMNERETDLLRIETVGGLLVCERRRNGDITVDMGEDRTSWQEIPLARETDALSVKMITGPTKYLHVLTWEIRTLYSSVKTARRSN